MNKSIEKILKDAEHRMVISNKGIYLEANEPAVLTMFQMAAEQIIKDSDLTKEDLIMAINNAGKDPNEALAELLENFKNVLKNLKDSIEKEKEN